MALDVFVVTDVRLRRDVRLGGDMRLGGDTRILGGDTRILGGDARILGGDAGLRRPVPLGVLLLVGLVMRHLFRLHCVWVSLPLPFRGQWGNPSWLCCKCASPR